MGHIQFSQQKVVKFMKIPTPSEKALTPFELACLIIKVLPLSHPSFVDFENQQKRGKGLVETMGTAV